MDKWLLIVNPSSATESTAGKWEESRKVLTDAGHEVDEALTGYAGHAITIASEAAEKGYRRFIAAGGDGTIHEVMTGLLRYVDSNGADFSDFTLAVLPYGTGNDWIRTAGIPNDISKAAACIIRGKTAKEDVVRARFENGVFCMANIGGIGVDADICFNTNTLKDKGYKGDLLYKMVAPWSVMSKKLRMAEVILDGENVYKGKLFSMVIGNGVYRGGGLKQNEEGGDWSDGILEMSILPGMSHFAGLGKMMHCLSGDFAVQPGIITKRFKKMVVTPLDGTPDRVELDGEIPGTLPLTIDIASSQINIIVP
ncbi:MAG: YegS/Rv2252/BmrU family lipid kinase [Bacteroidales bacterium]|nr:YegS/Rv2252/BmrU family lipid kinase [Bacteroidales bacterium]